MRFDRAWRVVRQDDAAAQGSPARLPARWTCCATRSEFRGAARRRLD